MQAQPEATNQRRCPICGESQGWRECPKKKPYGCPSCGGTRSGISNSPSGFSTNRRAADKNKLPSKATPLPTGRPASNAGDYSRIARIIFTAAGSLWQPQGDQFTVSPRPTVSAEVIKTNSLIIAPKQFVFQATINKQPITFLLDSAAGHSISSRSFAIRNVLNMQPPDQPISANFASSTTETIPFSAGALALQCQGHHPALQRLVSSNVFFELLVGLDCLSRDNGTVNWYSGSSPHSVERQCYKRQVIYSNEEAQDHSLASRLCSARQRRTYPTANENYVNFRICNRTPQWLRRPLQTQQPASRPQQSSASPKNSPLFKTKQPRCLPRAVINSPSPWHHKLNQSDRALIGCNQGSDTTYKTASVNGLPMRGSGLPLAAGLLLSSSSPRRTGSFAWWSTVGGSTLKVIPISSDFPALMWS